jgi:hypothetical protein
VFHASTRFEIIGVIMSFAGAESGNAMDLLKLNVIDIHEFGNAISVDIVRVVLRMVIIGRSCGLVVIFAATAEK